MSVNFFKSGLAFSLTLLAACANGSFALAEGEFGNLILGPQNAPQQMPGQMQMSAPPMQAPQMRMANPQMQGPQMQMAGPQMQRPQMQMQAPQMPQNYQPQPQASTYNPGPQSQAVDPRFSAQYANTQYSPQQASMPMSSQYLPQRPPVAQQQYLPSQYASDSQYNPASQYGNGARCVAQAVTSAPVKMQVPAGSSPVDLSIENLRFSEPGTVLVGPSYHITVRNNGSEYAPRFHIGLFASLDGVVNEQSPKAFLEVRDLAPGTAVDYTIRLPVNADSIPDPRTGQIRPFTHVAAVVDVFRLQPEGDETNNTAMLPRQVVDNAQ